MVADRPVDPHLLAQVTETAPAAMEALLAELAAAYETEDRGFVLVKVAGGYRFQSHPDLTGYVERFVLEGQNARLSSAALETMAIIAYKQPISRAQIASIRGVNVDGVVRTLEQRGYIAEVARDPGPGQAVAVRHHRPVPRAHRAGVARRPAAGGRVRARAPTWSRRSSTACASTSSPSSSTPARRASEASDGSAGAADAGSGPLVVEPTRIRRRAR